MASLRAVGTDDKSSENLESPIIFRIIFDAELHLYNGIWVERYNSFEEYIFVINPSSFSIT